MSSASGGIIRDSIQMGNYTTDTYLVDVLYLHLPLVIRSDVSSALPGQLEGILGLGEASCNPTCMPPIYQSVLAAEHGSCILSPICLHADQKEDMRFSVCFGRTAGKLYFDAYDSRVAVRTVVLLTRRALQQWCRTSARTRLATRSTCRTCG